MADCRAVSAAFDCPYPDAEHAPESGTGHPAAPSVFAPDRPADVAGNVLIGVSRRKIFDVSGLHVSEDQSFGLQSRSRGVTPLRVAKRPVQGGALFLAQAE